MEGNGPGSESNSVPYLADDLGQNTGLSLCLSFFIYTLELLKMVPTSGLVLRIEMMHIALSVVA